MNNFSSEINDESDYVAVSDLKQKAITYFYENLTSAQKESQNFLSSDEEIISYAKKIAEKIRRFTNLYSAHDDTVQVLMDIAYENFGIVPPVIRCEDESKKTVIVTVPVPPQNNLHQIFPDTHTVTVRMISVSVSVTAVLFRLSDEMWWTRKLRKYYKRKKETALIYFGKVNNRKGKYISDEGLIRFRSQKRRNRRILEKTLAINELGEEFSLQELSDKSVSNPELRRKELMTRIAGFGEIAKASDDVGMFYTVTCPSRMHSYSAITGKPNPKYDGTTPDFAQKYLVDVWARVRTKLNNMGIKLYGFRVAEPQHDATPHWHILVFMPKEKAKIIGEIIKKYFLEEDGMEAGANKYRYKEVFIDPKKGSAAGYIAKYISKNINGCGLDSDIDGGEPITASERVNAWANHWGIRQFQQLGGPPVTLWREIRKIGNGDLSGVIKDVHEAVNKPSWERFVNLLGGVLVKRKALALSLYKVSTNKLNQYAEPITNQIYGITDGLEIVKTRIHTWLVKYKSEISQNEAFDLVLGL